MRRAGEEGGREGERERGREGERERGRERETERESDSLCIHGEVHMDRGAYIGLAYTNLEHIHLTEHT